VPAAPPRARKGPPAEGSSPGGRLRSWRPVEDGAATAGCPQRSTAGCLPLEHLPGAYVAARLSYTAAPLKTGRRIFVVHCGATARAFPLQSGPNMADTYVGPRGRLRTRSWETRSSPTTARARFAGPPTARRWHEPPCGKRPPVLARAASRSKPGSTAYRTRFRPGVSLKCPPEQGFCQAVGASRGPVRRSLGWCMTRRTFRAGHGALIRLGCSSTRSV
jgi:hypothetical protein